MGKIGVISLGHDDYPGKVLDSVLGEIGQVLKDHAIYEEKIPLTITSGRKLSVLGIRAGNWSITRH